MLSNPLNRIPGGLLLATAVALGAFSAGSLRAENVLRVGYGEGSPGDTGINVIITASNDVPIHGYSVALSYPADVLVARSLGVEGTNIGTLGPEFVAPSINHTLGSAVLAVILDFDLPLTPSAVPATQAGEAPRIVARISFDIRPNAAGGLYPLRLIDGLGSPAAYNRFTVAGTSIRPRLEHGSFLVQGGHVLSLESKIAVAGASPSVSITAYAQHPEPLSGYSIGISFDGRALTLNSATLAGTSVAQKLGAGCFPTPQPSCKIEFFLTDLDITLGPSHHRSRTAVIFDYLPPVSGAVLAPVTRPREQSLMRYSFAVNAVAAASAEFQLLELRELEQPGALNNVFLVEDRSITPRREHGKIYFSLGDLTGRVVDAATGAGVSGVRVVSDPNAFEATTSATGDFRITSMIPGMYNLKLSRSGHYNGMYTGFTVTGRSQTDSAGSLALYRIPPIQPGTGVPFRRGFINIDSRADLSDAIWLLDFLFRGGEPPACMQAADVNASGTLDISDSIYYLNWLFSGGRPPAPPFDICARDANSALSCISSPVCPR
jgi:hypothetical protein